MTHSFNMKMCYRCLIFKEETTEFFYFRKLTGKLKNLCILCDQAYQKEYNRINSISLKKKAKVYRKKNEAQLKSKRKEYSKTEAFKTTQKINKQRRRAKDSCFKLRENINRSIRLTLNQLHVKKNKKSFLKYVEWTPAQLKLHLENLWEPWMNWNNYGRTKLGEKRWHIDHIIPQSILLYSSMSDDNFKKCWALENLRPMEAFANITKGAKVIQAD